MRIYLIGFMGCGKSTLGRTMAKYLDYSFIDLDDYIEERNFKSVPLLFEQLGEDGFRQKEQLALQEVSTIDNVVVATGGGAPCFFDNMDVMNKSGATIYMDLSALELTNRLLTSKTVRPLVKGKTPEELKHFIHLKLEERNEFYKQAEHIVDPLIMELSDYKRILAIP